MNNKHSKNTLRRLCISTFILFFSFPTYADFLEMPDIKESPELRSKSLLRDMDIPAVKFRSPDPTEGPRLSVSEFRAPDERGVVIWIEGADYIPAENSVR